MTVPYTFGTATSSIPLSQLDSNFATAITLGSTNVYLGNTTTTLVGFANLSSTLITSPTHNSGTTLSLQTGGTTGLYIDASQNVGIGTTLPSYGLDVGGTTTTKSSIRIQNGTAGSSFLLQSDTSGLAYVQQQANAALVFATNNSERMRIDSSGNLLVGATSFLYGAKLSVSGSLYMTGGSIENWAGAYNLYNSANQYIGLQWYKSATGSLAGNSRQAVIETQIDNKMNIKTDVNIPIYVIANASNGVYLSGGGTSWTSNSDERLKTDLVPIADAANKVVSLRAVTGRYKHDVAGTSRSFLIAQDVQKVLPEAINIQNDENNTLGLQYTDVIPLLVAAIQELSAKNDALEARLAALEGK